MRPAATLTLVVVGHPQMVAEYLRTGVPAGAVSAASNEIDGELQMLRRRRRDLEGWCSESAAESARMRNVWALADMAEERLGHLTLGQQAEVLRLLGIRVTVLDSTSNPRLRIQGSVPSAMTLLDAVTDWNLEHGAPLDPVAGVPGIGLPFVLEVNAA